MPKFFLPRQYLSKSKYLSRKLLGHYTTSDFAPSLCHRWCHLHAQMA